MGRLAVINTNILVSALISPHHATATVQIVAKMHWGGVTPVYCQEIMAEYREVLNRKKFGFSKELVDNLLAAAEKYGLYCVPAQTDIALPDEKDRPFYNAVCDRQPTGALLITGNLKHFPEAPFIVSARQFLDMLEQNQS